VTVGSAWVFTHSGAAWTQQAKLIGSKPGPTVQDGFGISVAVSADGNTALVGGYTYNDTVGAAFAFRRTGSTWRRLGKILTGTGEIGLGQFGATVALSADGRTAMVAAPGDDEGFGAVWFYTLGASGWTPASGKIKVKRAKGHSTFGSSAALSAHGDVAVIGGSRAGANKGAAWIFTRSGSTWKQGPELIAAGAAGATTLGYSASLSSSGTTAVVGGPNDHGGHGAAWVFTRSGSRWRQSSKLTATAEQGVGSFGFGVGVSADGKTAVIGGPNDSNGAGAAWIRRNT
jgi:hypothetical protein